MSSSSRLSQAQKRYRYTMLGSKKDSALGVVDDVERPESEERDRDGEEAAPALPWRKQIGCDLKLSRHRNT